MIRNIDNLFPQIIKTLKNNPFHSFEIFDLDDFESNESSKGYSFIAEDSDKIRDYLQNLGFKSIKSTNELFQQCYCFVYNRLSKNCIVRIYLSPNFEKVKTTIDYLHNQKDNIKTPLERYHLLKCTFE